MENGPKMPHEQPSWLDITLEAVHEKIAENKLEEARSWAVKRKKALQKVCEEIDEAVAHNQGEISAEKWAIEKDAIEQEITEFQNIIQTIDTDTAE